MRFTRPALARATGPRSRDSSTVDEVWPVEEADVELARNLSARHRGLDARDLVHLACCIRREPRELMTFDRGLAAAWRSRS